VALATVSECSLIVSWNFRHIVHFEKIPMYNAVSTLHGYKEIDIFSPLEVIYYQQEQNSTYKGFNNLQEPAHFWEFFRACRWNFAVTVYYEED
jgi:hypothetical protein